MSLERDSLESYLAQLEERIRNLETSPRIIATSQRGGSFTLIPPDGGPPALLHFGEFGDESGVDRYGVSLYDKNGATVLSIDEDTEGLLVPHFHRAMTKANDSVIVTSAAYVTTWEAGWEYTWHDCWKVTFVVITDPGTTATVRLTEGNSGQSTSALAIGANVQATAQFEWLHPMSIGWGDPGGAGSTIFLQVEAKRDSGAGNLYVFAPQLLERSRGFSPGAATNGAPVLI